MLSKHIDFEGAATRFAAQGVVTIPEFLRAAPAQDLLENLEKRSDWFEVFHSPTSTYEMPVEAFEQLDVAKRNELDQLIWREAERGFQFRFRTVRVPDDTLARTPTSDPLHAFVAELCGDDVLQKLRRITGCDAINFADGQATAYSAGHFLNAHDDAVEGKGRLAAYVFGLTKDWSADWGGQLIFPSGADVRGLLPEFNTLRIFSIPRKHSVTYVPPFVKATRYSITGWLRVLDGNETS